jgi:hypothetical protein
MMTTTEYTREDLIAICEKSSVQELNWNDRDSSSAQRQIGEALMLLKAGCEFRILHERDGLMTDEKTIWVEITSRGFSYHDFGGNTDKDKFYFPTQARLDEAGGRDWY